MAESIDVIALLGQFTHSRRDNEQTLAVAKALAKNGTLYQKSVFFNILIYLPSFILFFIPIWLLIKHNDGFTDVEHCDAIVVSGRKMIRYAKHIKKNAFTNAKIIQIGDPRYSVKVDVLLKPEHGKFLAFCKNVVKYRGHFCEKVDYNLLKQECERFGNIQNALKGPFIGVFIGERKYSFKMIPSVIEEFAKAINNISHNMKMPLLIATRENTPKIVSEILKKNLDCSYYFYDFNNNPSNNPKLAFMNWAEYYLLFSGSIVKQCELIAQGKPTYVYSEGSTSTKYERFLLSLISDGVVKTFNKNSEFLEKFEPKPLNDMDNICEKIEKTIIDNEQ